MRLATSRCHGVEISDAIVAFDPVTLQRKPVDFNVALVNEAQRLALIEDLRCKFAAANAFMWVLGLLRSRGLIY